MSRYLAYRTRQIDYECYTGRDPYVEEPEEGEVWDSERAGELRKEAVERNRRIMDTDPRKLPYEDFLWSDYWLDLSERLKHEAGYRCQLCGRLHASTGKGLQVHHKTYVHRGFEDPEHLGDLVVVCDSCHRRIHGRRSHHEA